MPLAFPADPELNDTYTLAGRTWRRNASGWVLERDVEIIGSIYSQIRPVSTGGLIYGVFEAAEYQPLSSTGVVYL
jgi:hypothetical protein